jgi:N-acetylated-alpha-linked acidic dipeptidase
MALELAQSTILPFNYTEYAVELRHYTRSIEQMMPTSTVSPLTHLHAAVDRLQRTGASVERMKLQLLDPSFPTNRLPVPEQWRRKKIKSLNQQLVMAERAWLDPVGLPGRLWYKHVVYAPGLWAGYGAATFPALTEAVERAVRESKRNSSSCPLWEEVRKLDARMAAFVDRVTNILTHY